MTIRRVVQIVVGVVVVAVVAAYGILASIDVDSYRGTIIKAAEDATGRKVEISGPLKLKVSFSPAVVVEGVKLSNAPWAKAPQMLTIGRAEAEIGLLAALTGTVQVNRLVVHDTTVDLVRRKDGSANWEFAPAAKGPAMTGPAPAQKAEEKGGAMPAIAVREVDVKNLKLSFDDAVSGQTIALDVKALSAAASSFSDPVKLALEVVYNGLPVSAKGSLGPIESLTQNKAASVDLGVTVPGVTLSAKGRIGKPMTGQDADIALNFDGKSYAEIGKALAIDLAAVPPLALTGTVKTSASAYSLENAVLKLGGQEVKLSAKAAMGGAKPKITASVTADSLDLPKLLAGLPKSDTAAPASGGKAAPAAKGDGKVFPADPLPLDGLFAADADAQVKIASLILPGGVKMAPAALSVSLKDGLFSAAPDLGVGGGTVGGKAVLDARPKGGPATLDIALAGKDVTLGQVVKDMGMTGMIAGVPTTMQINLKGTGKSVRALMAGLNGDINVESGKGEIVNAELRKAIGDWAMSGLTLVDSGFATRQKTVLSCLVVRVPVKQGVATIDKSIAAETDALNVVMAGSVDLRSEALDLGIDPMPQETANVGITQAAAGLVRVRGTLANPSTGVDLMGAGKAALKVGAAVATGGLSLLGDALIGQATKDPHPCQTAKGLTPAKTSGSTSKSGSSTSSGSSNPADAIGGAMKGLFGK